jgi:hypothetical protein
MPTMGKPAVAVRPAQMKWPLEIFQRPFPEKYN